MIRFSKSVLKNGLRVVGEVHPHSHAVAIGVWIENGTRDEPAELGGISHFLEHMVFKGTKNRSAYQIVRALEELGGDINAFTTREYTCYHCLVLKDHWKVGLEVLADLVNNMQISRADFDLEKGVILQEIGMTDDTPEDLIYDLFLEESLKPHPLGRSILGTVETVSRLKKAPLMKFYKDVYSAKKIIVSAAGNIDYLEFEKEVKKRLGAKVKGRSSAKREEPRCRPIALAIEKPAEQLHCLFGLSVSSFKDKDRFESYIVNALLGGGMTSRLYQSVREKKGLVYNISSSLNTFIDYGMINVYASCEPANMKKVIQGISKEFLNLYTKGVRKSDVDLFRTQVIGSIMLGADDIDNRMNSIAVNEMVFGKYKPVDDIISEINQVSVDSVNRFIEKYLHPKNLGVLVLGKGATELQGFLDERRAEWKKLKSK